MAEMKFEFSLTPQSVLKTTLLHCFLLLKTNETHQYMVTRKSCPLKFLSEKKKSKILANVFNKLLSVSRVKDIQTCLYLYRLSQGEK